MAGWTWGTLGDPKIGALLNAPMKALENFLGLQAKTMPVQSVVRTTDATVTTLHTVTIPVDTSVVVSGYVVARRTGGAAGAANDGAGYQVKFIAKNTAGTATVIGSTGTAVIGESVAGYDVTVVASSGNVLVRVTGVAATNITWAWSGRSLSIKE